MADQDQDPDSILNYYRRLIALRKSPTYKEVFTYGKFLPAYQDTEDVMAYYRKDEHTRILVAANFGKESVELPLDYPVKQVLLSNQHKQHNYNTESHLSLESCEVIEL